MGCGVDTQRKVEAIENLPKNEAGHVDFHTAWVGMHNTHIKYWLRDHVLQAHPLYYLTCFSVDKQLLVLNNSLATPLVLPPQDKLVEEAQIPPPASATLSGATPPAASPTRRSQRSVRVPSRYSAVENKMF